MKEKIKEICKNLEKEENIHILFAVENGSRAWRIASKDSDYDVRFVFVRPLEKYLQITKPEEVVNIAFDKEGKKCKLEDSFIDISGFDIFKFVTLLSSSNPTTIEWLVTDIIYYGKQNKVFREFAIKNFSPVALYHHYKSICRNNYAKYIMSGKDTTYKRYLHIFRGLINAKWVANKKTIPPISFVVALDKISDKLPANIVTKLYYTLNIKSKGKEKERIDNITEMDEYINDFLKDKSEEPTEKHKVELGALNNELKKIILKQNDRILPRHRNLPSTYL